METTHKRLRRSRSDALLGGVAGGLAVYLNFDSALVRLGWVLITLAGGAGVLLYLLAWLIIPDENGQRTWVPLIMLVVGLLLPAVIVLSLIWPLTVVTNR